MSNLYDILITANSPGELAGWVAPVAQAFQTHFPEARLTLILTPCHYSSGTEAEFAKNLGAFSHIVLPEEFTQWIAKRKPPPFELAAKGAILYLGGDLLHPILIARKVGYPAFAYTTSRIQWAKQYHTFFLPQNNKKIRQWAVRKKIETKTQIVEDLMVDSVKTSLSREETYRYFSLDRNKPIVTFFTGSRPDAHQALLAFFRPIAQELKQRNPDVQCVFSLSPFIRAAETEKTFPFPFPFYPNHGVDLLNITTLLVTIPGTSTTQAATLGTPMLVLLPLHRPDLILLDGLFGLLSDLPLIGRPIKQLAILALRPFMPYLALPNLMAQRKIVPELVGHLSTEQVVAAIQTELTELPKKRESLAQELKMTVGEKGAAEKIVKCIQQTLQQPQDKLLE